MTGPDPVSPPLRVVVVSDDPKLRARAMYLRADGWRLAFAPTGYEAAAELLAGPVAALLVDLRALTPRHEGLLELAREAGAAAYGIAGPVPSDMAGRLGELRPVDIEDVPAILASLGRKWARAQDEARQSDSEKTPEDAPGHEQAGLYVPRSDDEPTPTETEPASEPAGAKPAEPPADAAPKPKTLGERLTDAEIASLLEDGP